MVPASGMAHSPVQIQKLLFLIDREIPKLVGGPHFDFEPYQYGPFDSTVYSELRSLRAKGLVDVDLIWWGRRGYSLSPEGQEKGEAILGELNEKAQAFIQKTSKFVRGLSFSKLVAAIYKAYPEMRENSVFQEP